MSQIEGAHVGTTAVSQRLTHLHITLGGRFAFRPLSVPKIVKTITNKFYLELNTSSIILSGRLHRLIQGNFFACQSRMVKIHTFWICQYVIAPRITHMEQRSCLVRDSAM